MAVTQAGNGGIGTTNPEAKLHVDGHVLLGHGNYLEGKDGSDSINSYIGMDLTSRLLLMNSKADGYVSLFTGGGGATNERVRVDSGGNVLLAEAGGNVGIGTTSPGSTTKLVVNVGAVGGYAAGFTNNGDQDVLFNISAVGASDKVSLIAPSVATNLAFGVGGAEKMRVTNTGNVGIGTTDPGDKLSVVVSGPAGLGVGYQGTGTNRVLMAAETNGTAGAEANVGLIGYGPTFGTARGASPSAPTTEAGTRSCGYSPPATSASARPPFPGPSPDWA